MRFVTLPLLVLALAAGPSFADGPVDLLRKDAWKVGDDVQVTIREDSSREIKFPGREETVGPSQPQRVKTLAVALEHCLETDATGRRARYRR